MKVAVTGASGFVGGLVAAEWARVGAEIVEVGRSRGSLGPRGAGAPNAREFRFWDAASHDAPDFSGCDVVVHCAAAVGDSGDADWFRAVNIEAARRVVAAARGAKLIWMSSASVYDPRGDGAFIREDHPTAGGHLSHYGATKAQGERIALDAGAVVLRPTAVYGLGDRHLIPRLTRLVKGNRLILPGADVRLSLTDGDALARATVDAAVWVPGAYNIADPQPYSRDEVLARVLPLVAGKELKPLRVPKRVLDVLQPVLPGVSRYSLGMVTRSRVLDASKAIEAGWRPTMGRVFEIDWRRWG